MYNVINRGHIVGFLREADVLQLTYSVIPPHSLIQQHIHTPTHTYMCTHIEHKQALSFDHCVAEKKALLAVEVTVNRNAWKLAFQRANKPAGTEMLI